MSATIGIDIGGTSVRAAVIDGMNSPSEERGPKPIIATRQPNRMMMV